MSRFAVVPIERGETRRYRRRGMRTIHSHHGEGESDSRVHQIRYIHVPILGTDLGRR